MVSQSYQYEPLKLKPSARGMFWPTVFLGAISFGLAFGSETLAPEIYEIALWAAASAAGLFWLLPLVSYLAASLSIYSNRIIYRSGFLGLRVRELDLTELSSIKIQRAGFLAGKQISILTIDGAEFLIRGYARTKLLAAEIENLARASF